VTFCSHVEQNMHAFQWRERDQTFWHVACLFPWLLLFLKQTTWNNSLVTIKKSFIVHGSHCFLRLKCRGKESSSLLLLAWRNHSPLFTWTVENVSTIHINNVNNGAYLQCSGRTGSDLKLNALNRVRPNKIKKYIFNF
jgi:hypothetical protein